MDVGHFSALQAKHAGLEARLKAESARPYPDSTIVATLKKQKLLVKQELSQIAS
jgi:hypothetical protein